MQFVPATAGSSVRVATAVLTNDEIKALPTVAATLFEAEGEDVLIIPLWATLVFHNPDGPVYGNINGDSWLVIGTGWNSGMPLETIGKAPDGSLVQGISALLANIGGTGLKQVTTLFPERVPIVEPEAVWGAKGFMQPTPVRTSTDGFTSQDALSMYIENLGDGNLNGGHVNNTLTVTFAYMLIDLSG